MNTTAEHPVELAVIREDHGAAEGAAESSWWDEQGGRNRFGVSALQGYRAGWWAGVEWLLNQQNRIDELTDGQMLAELRKGPGSVYWPIKSDDASFWADCPGCRRPRLIDAEGLCRECGHEFEEAA